MRLWSVHPCHLDAKGLVALWREGLLALAVAQGKTKGYRHHPQLVRFANCRHPVFAIERYLLAVHTEARSRGYLFDRAKIGPGRTRIRLTVTQGQLDYEWQHLLRKLYRRDRARWTRQKNQCPTAHPFFDVVPGPVETWERT
jgi:hypothetical protein